jgi:hypothetical protein
MPRKNGYDSRQSDWYLKFQPSYVNPFVSASFAILNRDVRFEVFTAVTMKNAVFWDVAPCRSYVNRSFGGTYRLHLQNRDGSHQFVLVV